MSVQNLKVHSLPEGLCFHYLHYIVKISGVPSSALQEMIGNNVADPFGLVLIWQNRDTIFSVHRVMCFVFNKYATFSLLSFLCIQKKRYRNVLIWGGGGVWGVLFRIHSFMFSYFYM